MTKNDFKSLSQIINNTLFFSFINKNESEINESYIFNYLLEYHGGLNPLALAVSSDNLMPETDRNFLKHLHSKKSQLRSPKMLRKNRNERKHKLLRKFFVIPQRKKLPQREARSTSREEFSLLNDSLITDYKAINSLNGQTRDFLESKRRSFKLLPVEERKIAIEKLINEVSATQKKLKIEILNILIPFTFEGNSEVGIKNLRENMKVFLNLESNTTLNNFLENASPVYIESLYKDLKRILINLNDISKEDSPLYLRLRFCKFYQDKCSNPIFYAYDSAQTTCGSNKCQRRNRTNKFSGTYK